MIGSDVENCLKLERVLSHYSIVGSISAGGHFVWDIKVIYILFIKYFHNPSYKFENER